MQPCRHASEVQRQSSTRLNREHHRAGSCTSGFTTSELEVADFVRYPIPANETGSAHWWGEGLDPWDVPLGCGYFGCDTTLSSFCESEKKVSSFQCVFCAGAPLHRARPLMLPARGAT